MTDPLGQSQVLPYLFRLSKLGYEFTLISCEKEEKYKQRGDVILELCKAYNIQWIPLKYTKSPPVFSTIYDVYKINKLVRRLTISKRFDIVHCRSYIAALVGLNLKKSLGTKFIFDMRGFWADERVDGQIWSLKNPVYKSVYYYFKKKEKQFLENADHTISLTQCAVDEIKTWKNIKREVPLTVIPCSADMNLFNANMISKCDTNALKLQLGLAENDFILSYIGSIGTWYMLDEMLDFFKVLKRERADSKFLFITNDPSDRILTKAKERGLSVEDIIITQAQREKMPLYISLSNYTIFFIKPSYSKKASSPVKQGEAMSMGIPIICNSGVGDTDMIVRESQAGIVLNHMTNEEHENAVKEMLSKSFDKNHIINGAKKWYSLDTAIQFYADVYINVLKK